MWDRTLNVSSMARYLARANRLVPGNVLHEIAMNRYRDIDGLYIDTPPHISFTNNENQFGQSQLRSLGIPDGSSFVCMNARESSYLDNSDFRGPHAWNYHDHRDSSIVNYLPAAEELARQGETSVRMGAIVSRPFDSPNPKIIDYANGWRNDFMDIYLAANCKFFLGDSAGLFEVARLFRRPIAWVNFIPLEGIFTFEKRGLVIPKHLWLRKEKRAMTFRETLESGAGRLWRAEKFDEMGIEVIENTPEEITLLASEMNARINGTWESTDEDNELQQRFWTLFKSLSSPDKGSSSANGVLLALIGSDFLRQNQHLLE